MSQRAGYTNGQLLNHGSVAASFSRTEAVYVKTAGTLEVQFAGEGNSVVNFGSVAAGTFLEIAIKQTTTATTADIILLR